MKKIATASYDFKAIRENDYAYVDKTSFLHRLVADKVDARYFIARPRRFGKSLMLSSSKTNVSKNRRYTGFLEMYRRHNVATNPILPERLGEKYSWIIVMKFEGEKT